MVILPLVVAACGSAGTASKGAGSQGAAPQPQAPAQPAQPAQAQPAKLETTKVRLGLAVSTPAYLPIYMADKHGMFKEQGLDVEIFTFQGGSDSTKALIGNQIDILDGGVNGVIDAYLAERPIKIFYGAANTSVYEWWGRPGLKSVKDPGVKTFAIGRVGDQPYFLTRWFLQKEGVNPEKVEFVQAGAPASRLAALIAKQVDVASLIQPDTEVAREQGFVQLGKLSTYISGFPLDVLAASDKFITENPNTIKAFLRAHDLAVAKVQSDKAAALKLLDEQMKLTGVKAENAYNAYAPSFPKNGEIPEDGLKFVLDLALDSGIVKTPLAAATITDYRYMKK